MENTIKSAKHRGIVLAFAILVNVLVVLDVPAETNTTQSVAIADVHIHHGFSYIESKPELQDFDNVRRLSKCNEKSSLTPISRVFDERWGQSKVPE